LKNEKNRKLRRADYGGIGTALANELIKRKAAKIYAAGISTRRLNDLAAKHPNIIVPKVSRSPQTSFF